MNSDAMMQLMYSLCLLSAFLLLGMFLRAKVPIFRKLFLPASVVGGFVLLLLGPQILHSHAVIPVPEDWITMWANLPGVLVVPIFAATPLGYFSSKRRKPAAAAGGENAGKQKKKGKLGAFFIGSGSLVLVSGLIRTVDTNVQFMVGYGTNLVYSALNPGAGLYRTFGYELEKGFAGGHGSAATVGNLLKNYGLDYWNISQGITTTTATVGLVGGMLIGIILINIAARRGLTSHLKSSANLSNDELRGFCADPEKQGSLGRETTLGSSIETITVHLAIILLACGVGFILQALLDKKHNLPVWFACMFAMYPIDFLISKLGLGWMIDKKVKNRIVGVMSDFAIIAAIASLPVEAVLTYLAPTVIMMAVGFVASFLVIFGLSLKLLSDRDPFEHAILAWGYHTGVLITGLMLLKICDPDYETTALSDHMVTSPIFSIVTSIPTLILGYRLLRSGTTMANFLYHLVLFVVYFALALVFYAIYNSYRKKHPKEAAVE